MAILEEDTIILAEVDEIHRQASTDATLIIEENNNIYRQNYNTYIMEPMAKNTKAIGWPSDIAIPEDENGGLYKKIEDANSQIDAINESLNDEIKKIATLQTDMTAQKGKKILEGKRMRINLNTDFDLLAENAQLNQTFTNLLDYIRNDSDYRTYLNLHLNISYTLKDNDSVDDNNITVYTNTVIHLDSPNNRTAVKKVALFLPIANTTILLEITTINNNMIIKVIDKEHAKEALMTNSRVLVDYGELEIKYVATGDATDNGSTGGTTPPTDETEEEPIIVAPLTLCFDPRFLYENGDNNVNKFVNKKNSNEGFMLGSQQLKFSIDNLGENYSNVSLEYNGLPYPSEGGPAIDYQYGTIKEVITIAKGDNSYSSTPVPSVVYYKPECEEIGLTSGIWFNYKNLGPNQCPTTYVSKFTLENFDYNKKLTNNNYPIKFKNPGTLSSLYKTIKLDGDKECVFLDYFCIPFEQWGQFFNDSFKRGQDIYKFKLKCKMNNNLPTEFVEITEHKYADNERNQNILILYYKDKDGVDREIMAVINYEGATTETNGITIYGDAPHLRPGIYARNDVQYFVVTIEKYEPPASAGDGGTQPST